MKRYIAYLMDGLMLVFAYTGFIVGNETAQLIVMVGIAFLCAIAVVSALMLSAFVMVHRQLTGKGRPVISEDKLEAIKSDPEMLRRHKVAFMAAVKASRSVSPLYTIAFDTPVVVMAFIGGFYIAGIAYAIEMVAHLKIWRVQWLLK